MSLVVGSRVFRVGAILFGLAVLSHPVSAEEVAKAELSESADAIQTPDVVVSATKTEIPIKQVTSAVEVITG